jgi:hypothetical protein
MNDTLAAKARRLVEAGAVEITYRGPDGIVARITGDSGIYRANLDHDATGWCSCPARGQCAHLEALRLIAADLPDDDDTDRDPFSGLGPGEPLQEGTATRREAAEPEVLEPVEPEPAPTRGALAVRSGDPAALDLSSAPVTWRTLEALSRTEFAPAGMRGRPAALLGVLLLGRDLGLGPMESLLAIDSIDGVPALSAELQLKLYRAAGHRLDVIRADDQAVELEGTRANTGEKLKVKFDLADALRAGLVDKLDGEGRPVARSKAGKAMPWQTFTPDLLWARAVTRLCRRLAPDALGQGRRPPVEGVAG